MQQFDARLDDEILAVLAEVERDAPSLGERGLPIYDVLRYHLGFVNADFAPERSDAGKRIRPRLCVLSCAAAGGDPALAIHTAAAIELLHNFTLIHDDIQDESPLRRHRDTVWARWGTAQAINAGDAMFAAAHLALNRSVSAGIDPVTVLQLSNRLHQTTLRIVEGQVLDLGFEQRTDVAVSEYFEMIAGKTAAITECACWSGALIAGAGVDQRNQLGEFGLALGVGFQLRDDLLGVWGSPEDTGKAAADDIRRKKKPLPNLLLLERSAGADREIAERIFSQDEVGPDDVTTILGMMERYEIEPDVQAQVQSWHDRAAERLYASLPTGAARTELEELIESLVSRSS